ncbi:hypothetical protein [Leptothoe kymatousa]|uniref:hypothetical protein n=1 Tax=Leptothoe kymatousa TaxID=2651727 RepID=UPI001C01CCEC|nr:hypothetical protein [Leptothoe kymatousa]
MYGLSVGATPADSPAAQAIVPYDAPFSVQITLAFEATNAIALLALAPTIQVDFYMKPLQAGATIDLGTSTLIADSQQSLYTLQLALTPPAELNLTTDKVYHLGAVVRVGAPAHPALLCGVLEAEHPLQIYTPRASVQTDNTSIKAAKKRASKTKK